MTVRSIEEMRAATRPDALLPFRWVGPRDRRGGFAHMADGLHDNSPRPEEARWLASHALREVGWQDGMPLPVIWRVAGRPSEVQT